MKISGALRMGLNKYILMLTLTFLYTGLVLTFWSGVYGSAVGFTNDFGSIAKSLVIHFLNGPSRPHFCLFSKKNITFFSTNKCEECPSYIQCWDSNP